MRPYIGGHIYIYIFGFCNFHRTPSAPYTVAEAEKIFSNPIYTCRKCIIYIYTFIILFVVRFYIYNAERCPTLIMYIYIDGTGKKNKI